MLGAKEIKEETLQLAITPHPDPLPQGARELWKGDARRRPYLSRNVR